MDGTVKKTEDNKLVIALNNKKSEYYKTQQSLAIAPHYLKRFNLKEGDQVVFDYGEPFQYIKIRYISRNNKQIRE